MPVKNQWSEITSERKANWFFLKMIRMYTCQSLSLFHAPKVRSSEEYTDISMEIEFIYFPGIDALDSYMIKENSQTNGEVDCSLYYFKWGGDQILIMPHTLHTHRHTRWIKKLKRERERYTDSEWKNDWKRKFRSLLPDHLKGVKRSNRHDPTN